jgi:probable rRNA maturation factor
MSLTVDVATDGERVPMSRSRIGSIARDVLRAERVREALISITFVGSSRIASLNRAHLDHRGSTDVISFGFSRPSRRDPVMGDIYIAPAVARRNAIAAGVPIREELTRLVVHGVLHVLGHDHPDGEARMRSAMWRRQERLVARFKSAGARS